MANLNIKQRSVNVHDFAMVPRADIPRSSFRMEKNLKTAHSASFLIPIMVEEVLPGDTFNVGVTVVARIATPIVPVMDNWHYETFFFYVPNRLLWSNWQRFMGEQPNPGDSISFTIPQVVSPSGGWAVASIGDYMGLPTAGQILGGNTISTNVLPFRAYNLIWRDWFRDQNLQGSTLRPVNLGDGPDANTDYALIERGKKHDYFTSALPNPQKGTAVSFPLQGNATVRTNATDLVTGAATSMRGYLASGAQITNMAPIVGSGAATIGAGSTVVAGSFSSGIYPSNLYADLTTVTATTINTMRQSFQIQRLLERDARGGTRYTEIVRSHFGVVSPDARLDRPEYLGGGRTSVTTSAIPQTSATGLTGGTTPAGSLAAVGTLQGRQGFTYSATEHGYIIGLAQVRADLTYDQGLRKLWSRSTRYDFYFPVFAHLGEQAILNREIYADGSINDALVFGYQERWAELRYNPSQITGVFRARAAGNIAFWHSAENFVTLPALNDTFIRDNTRAVIARNLAAGVAAVNQQFLVDILYTMNVARPLPMYSVPGLIDHF